MSGVKVDENPDNQVTMVTVSSQPQDGSRNGNSNSYYNLKNNTSGQHQEFKKWQVNAKSSSTTIVLSSNPLVACCFFGGR